MIQEIREVGEFHNLLICEPFLQDGLKRTEMESLAVVVKAETVEPILTQDVEVSLALFSIKIASICSKGSLFRINSLRRTLISTKES